MTIPLTCTSGPCVPAGPVAETTSSRPSFSSHPLRPDLTHGPGPSLLKSASGLRRRRAGERPRVLLLVPPYTRYSGPSPAGSAFAEIGLDTFEVMKRAGTPIGLLRIATAARARGYDVRIVDAPFEGWDQESVFLRLPEGRLLRYGLTDEQLRRIVEEFEPDVVGIQCNYTVQWGNARALADLIKTIDRKLVVVSGGAHVSGDWSNTLRDAPIDILVVNEADRTFAELLDALTDPNQSVENVAGIRYRAGDRLVNSDRELRGTDKTRYISLNPRTQTLGQRMDLMPLPDFGFLDMRRYAQPFHSAGARRRPEGAWAQIFSTVGCNVGCDFCYIPLINGPWRALGTDWFDLHLADLKKHGISEVLIEDDHLLHDPLYAMEVFRLLEKHDLPWVEEGGLSLFNLILLHQGLSFADTLTPEEKNHPNFRHVLRALRSGLTARDLIGAMARSGCYNVYLAVETANEESLENSNKPRINAIQQATREIVGLFAEADIQVTGGFMLGFVNPPASAEEEPYIESLAQVDRTIDYAVMLMGAGMAYANPFIVTPIPGTRMWQFQKDYAVRDYDLGWSHERATMATPRWSAEDMENMRLKLLVKANGAERVKAMLQRGTWPVDPSEHGERRGVSPPVLASTGGLTPRRSPKGSIMGEPIQDRSPRGSLAATLIGLGAILSWSSLALLTTWVRSIPPFQLTALTFLVAFAASAAVIGVQSRGSLSAYRLPRRAWVLGVGGLFGYHFLYFLALRSAPAAHASLIAYLWPMLIVVLSSFLPGERLRWFHVVACATGFGGAALLVLRGAEAGLEWRYVIGYFAALGCALTWSVYSVLSRALLRGVSSNAVSAYCGGTGVLALACHLLLETTVWPTPTEWLVAIALGLGPVGSAFFAWDYGVKRGNLKALGGASYLAPLFSTTLLVVTGAALFSWTLLLSCVLIVAGAVLASGDLFKRRSSRPPRQQSAPTSVQASGADI